MEKRHYSLAPELMALYAEALIRAQASDSDKSIAALVVGLVNQGNLLRRAGRGLRAGRFDQDGDAAA